MASLLGRLTKLALVLGFLAAFAVVPARGGSGEAIHEEMRAALAGLSEEHFTGGAGNSHEAPSLAARARTPSSPWLILVGFTGGIEPKDSSSSGIIAIKKRLDQNFGIEDGVLNLAFNNFRWRRALTEIVRAVITARQDPAFLPEMRQPLIVTYGHSWGAGSMAKLARGLKKEGLEISLAIYIDAFCWRNPRLPDNIRYAVNFYQRSGILKGLPMRGKSKLIPQDPQATQVLGNYRIDPRTESWGWSWNLLQPLLFRQHHRIAHDKRLQEYLADIVIVQLALLDRAYAESRKDRAGLHDLNLSAATASGGPR